MRGRRARRGCGHECRGPPAGCHGSTGTGRSAEGPGRGIPSHTWWQQEPWAVAGPQEAGWRLTEQSLQLPAGTRYRAVPAGPSRGHHVVTAQHRAAWSLRWPHAEIPGLARPRWGRVPGQVPGGQGLGEKAHLSLGDNEKEETVWLKLKPETSWKVGCVLPGPLGATSWAGRSLGISCFGSLLGSTESLALVAGCCPSAG